MPTAELAAIVFYVYRANRGIPSNVTANVEILLLLVICYKEFLLKNIYTYSIAI